jgi:uncharacterized membrane protein
MIFSKALPTLAAASLLIMLVSVPLMLEKIPKNSFYGFRTKLTMSGSDQAWYRTNRIAGIGLFIAGFISFVSSLLVPQLLSDPHLAASLCTGIIVASILAATGIAYLQQGK